MKKAPWPDFEGNELFEGDTIKHPSGQAGTIVYRPDRVMDNDKWLIQYCGCAFESRLCLQVGKKGRAVKALLS